MPRAVDGRDAALTAPPEKHLHFLPGDDPTRNPDAPRPPGATLDEHTTIQRQPGIDRAVIVQPNACGMDALTLPIRLTQTSTAPDSLLKSLSWFSECIALAGLDRFSVAFPVWFMGSCTKGR